MNSFFAYCLLIFVALKFTNMHGVDDVNLIEVCCEMGLFFYTIFRD